MEKIFADININDQNFFSPARFANIGSIVDIIVRNALMIAGIMTFLGVIMGGFSMITAAGSGDSKKMEQARNTLTAGVLGLLIIVGAVWIVQVLGIISGITFWTQ